MNWLALIQGLIPVAVGIAEQIHGAKTGPQKLATVTSIAQEALGIAAAVGAIPAAALPTTATLIQQINSTVASMNTSGQLPE